MDLARTIRNGLPGTAMPAYRDLFSDGEVADLISYIYSLRPDTAGGEPLPEPMTIPTVDAAGDPTLEDGRSLYLMLGCWRCHGMNGAGDGPSAATLTDDEERRIHSTDLRFDPFKGGRTPHDVVRALLTGLNGSPMPAYGDAMLIASDDETGDLPADTDLDEGDGAAIARFLQESPSRSALGSMDDAERNALRDRRLAALAHYVLSLDRRRGAGYWLFRAEPEREGRSP